MIVKMMEYNILFYAGLTLMALGIFLNKKIYTCSVFDIPKLYTSVKPLHACMILVGVSMICLNNFLL
jgi:hypothetical protein